MRLIDADALEELFREVIGNIAKRPEIGKDLEHMVRASAMAVQMIQDAPTIGDWISVKDRLPEDGQDVLVWDDGGFAYIDERLCGTWKYGGNYGVTHWMPLPEPPKEVSGDAADADALKGPLELQQASYARIGATERAEAYANCLWEIAQAPTIEGENWIGADKRPKKPGKYLVYGVTMFAPDHNGEPCGCWEVKIANWSDKWGWDCKVKRWRPLPEPPKEGENG